RRSISRSPSGVMVESPLTTREGDGKGVSDHPLCLEVPQLRMRPHVSHRHISHLSSGHVPRQAGGKAMKWVAVHRVGPALNDPQAKTLVVGPKISPPGVIKVIATNKPAGFDCADRHHRRDHGPSPEPSPPP